MSIGFTNESVHRLDAKHRVFVPKRFQSLLASEGTEDLTCVLTRGQEGCVFLFSREGYEEFKAHLKSKPFGDRNKRAVNRKIFSKTALVQLDGSGRVLIPDALVRFAGLDKEVVMVGVDDHAEIWDKAAWERYENETEEVFQRLDEVMEPQTSSPGV